MKAPATRIGFNRQASYLILSHCRPGYPLDIMISTSHLRSNIYFPVMPTLTKAFHKTTQQIKQAEGSHHVSVPVQSTFLLQFDCHCLYDLPGRVSTCTTPFVSCTIPVFQTQCRIF